MTGPELLPTWELKELVDKLNDSEMSPYFKNAFKKMELAKKERLSFTNLYIRGDVQFMIDNIKIQKHRDKFKMIYKK